MEGAADEGGQVGDLTQIADLAAGATNAKGGHPGASVHHHTPGHLQSIGVGVGRYEGEVYVTGTL